MPLLFENAFNHAAIGMALVGLDGQFLRVNRSLCQLVGYAEDKLLASTFQDITHPDDLKTDLAYVGQMIRGEIESYQMEKRYRRQDGGLVWVLLSVSLARENDGAPRCFISQIQDITARKEAEQDLALFFDLPMVFRAVLTPDGTFQRVSAQWMHALGYTREQFLQMSALSLVHPDEAAGTVAALAGLFDGRSMKYFQNRLRRADGSYLWFMSCAIRQPERSLAFVVSTDITPLKEAEARALADAREKQRLYEELRQVTDEVVRLQEGLISICAWTKQIRDGEQWKSVEEFLTQRLHLRLTHGISDDASKALLQPERARSVD